jgi:hypothetical protein
MTAVFTTPDGTPQSGVVTNSGMSVRTTQVNPGHTASLFTSQGSHGTPVLVSGWTVQDASTGSNQHTVRKG